MKRTALALLCGAAFLLPAAARPEQRLAWQTFPGVISSALHAFRQTYHWAAQAMAENMDGDRLGRESAEGLPLNFDPTRHLHYVVRDMNDDGRPEVFLLFTWATLRGNSEAAGVVMVQTRPAEWRIGCDFRDWGDEGPRGGIRLLDRRDHGWRRFRTSDAIYAWRPVRGQPGVMECVGIVTIPLGRPR